MIRPSNKVLALLGQDKVEGTDFRENRLLSFLLYMSLLEPANPLVVQTSVDYLVLLVKSEN